MSLDNGKVTVPWSLAEAILMQGFPAATLRLAFSMLHQLDLAGVCGPHSAQECPSIWATCVALRERIGPPSTKSVRDIRAAAEELAAAGVVEEAQLLKRNTALQWRFAPWVWELMRYRLSDNYVLVDLAELGRFRSSYVIGLYLICRKVRGSRAPVFMVPVDLAITEEANTRRLLSALRQLAGLIDCVFHVGMEYRRDEPAPERYIVKMTHEATRWKKHAYLKFSPSAKVWRVTRDGHARLARTEVRDQRRQLIERDGRGPA